MTDLTQPDSREIDALLEQLLVDAYGDDEQLTAILEGMESEIELPIDIRVVGEPMTLVAIDYEGNSRRGLDAQCKRANGSKHRVSLADVQIQSHAQAYRFMCAYCRWLGVEPIAIPSSCESTGRPDKVSENEVIIDVSVSVELIVIVVKQRAVRCRQLTNDRIITVKAPTSYLAVPGQIITIQPKKFWHFKGHPYLSGDIISSRIDVEVLGLPLLTVGEVDVWDPQEESILNELNSTDGDACTANESIGDWYKSIIARGPRPVFEMQLIMPGHDLEDMDGLEFDPIIESIELRERGDYQGASQILDDLLEADLRCLDAHAHLGNMVFDSFPATALDHYSMGVNIGLQALGTRFTGLLPWSLMGNRPFLRCLYGYGVCLWRLERWGQAGFVFERLMDLCPLDDLDAFGMLAMVKREQPYNDGNID